MIFQPTTSGSPSIVTLAEATAVPRAVDLNSEPAWSDLIGCIVGIANSGGGRLEVRCIAGIESEKVSDRVFSARIEPTVPKPVGPKNGTLVNLQPVRIVTDPGAPALQPQDVDRLYPW